MLSLSHLYYIVMFLLIHNIVCTDDQIVYVNVAQEIVQTEWNTLFICCGINKRFIIVSKFFKELSLEEAI